MIFGRGVYQTVVPFWTRVAMEGLPEGMPFAEPDLEFARIMAPLPKYVVSRSFEPSEPGVTVIRNEIVGRVRSIKEAEYQYSAFSWRHD